MNPLDDYDRETARKKVDLGYLTCVHAQTICYACIVELVVSAYTQGAADQKRGAVAALAKLENDAWCVDGGLVSKGRARQAVMDSQPDASKGEMGKE